MLVLAPAACIMSGIALSQAFDVFTRSIKFQLPGILRNSEVDVSMFTFFYTALLYSSHDSMMSFGFTTNIQLPGMFDN